MKIEKILNKKKGIYEYQARFQLGGREFRPRALTRKILLETIDEIRARQHRKDFDLPIAASSPRLSQLLSKRIEHIQNKRERTFAKRVFAVFAAVVPEDFKVGELRQSHLQSYIQKRLPEVQPQTVNREMTAIASALHKASLYFPELENWNAPKIPRAASNRRRRERLITEGEKTELLKYLTRAAGPGESPQKFSHRVRLAHWIEFALLTGLRRKEIAGLHWTDYDRKNNSLRVVRWKTDTVTNFSPLPRRAVEILEARGKIEIESKFIFTKSGKPVESDYRTLKNICAHLEIPYGRSVAGGFIVHDARHNFTTEMLKIADIETVRSFTGHSSDVIMTYAHTSKESRERAISKFDGVDLDAEIERLYKQVKTGKLTLEEFTEKIRNLAIF